MSGNERKFFVPIIGKGGRPKGSEPGEVLGNIKEVKQREKTWGEMQHAGRGKGGHWNIPDAGYGWETLKNGCN